MEFGRHFEPLKRRDSAIESFDGGTAPKPKFITPGFHSHRPAHTQQIIAWFGGGGYVFDTRLKRGCPCRTASAVFIFWVRHNYLTVAFIVGGLFSLAIIADARGLFGTLPFPKGRGPCVRGGGLMPAPIGPSFVSGICG